MCRINEFIKLQKKIYLKRLDKVFIDISDCEVKDQIRDKLLNLDLLDLDTDVLNFLRKDYLEWVDIPKMSKDIMRPTKRWIQKAYDKVSFFCLFYWGGGILLNDSIILYIPLPFNS